MQRTKTIRSRFPLLRGQHPSRLHGVCTMELVAWLAGEPHSDAPECACPSLTALIRAINDLIPNGRREALLRPIAPALVRSRVDDGVAQARAWIAADATARFLAPLGLERADAPDAAAALRGLPAIDGPRAAAAAEMILVEAAPIARAARWTLGQAAAGRPATLWLPGVAHAVRDGDAWGAVPRLIDDMLAVRRTQG